jgi:hypothetical protein
MAAGAGPSREGDAGTASKQTTSPAADAADNVHRSDDAQSEYPDM